MIRCPYAHVQAISVPALFSLIAKKRLKILLQPDDKINEGGDQRKESPMKLMAFWILAVFLAIFVGVGISLATL
jgi:hypothetical protein